MEKAPDTPERNEQFGFVYNYNIAHRELKRKQ